MGWPPGWTDPTQSCARSYADWREHQHDWFDEDPVESLPRTAIDVLDRPARLMAIGNGQVPACVVLAWEILGKMCV
jgi:hypothetical protein